LEYEDLENRFIGALQIRGQPMRAGIAAESIFMDLYEAVFKIWAKPWMYKFVDHGLDHSYRVLRKSLKLASRLAKTRPLCTYELVILGMATLLHDIGMQYGKYYPKEGLSWAETRKQHCRLGMKMVDTFLSESNHSEERPMFTLVKPEDPYRKYLDEAASIAFAHADKELWQQLCEKGFEELPEGTDAFLRPQLLAALLRFGDELDMNWERVSDINLLRVQDYLTPEEMAHWCACYYVNDTHIDLPESGGIRIEIVWRVPKEATEAECRAIRTLIYRFRTEKTKAELEKVEDYLIPRKRTNPPVIKIRMPPNPVPERIDSPPSKVLEYIDSIMRPPSKPLPQIRPLKNMDELKRLAIDFFEIERPTMFHGHVALRTGWHTNTFLQCRNLVTKREFAAGLANLSQNEEFKEARFTDVLAYGTSSIRVGSIIALELGTRLSYTFWKGDSYMPYERSYHLSSGSRVLVLDDILSVGTVANRILREVLERYEPERLDFLVIYLLGEETRIEPEIVRKANIRYLVHRPEITYFKEDPNDGLCDYCRDHPDQLTREDDLFY